MSASEVKTKVTQRALLAQRGPDSGLAAHQRSKPGEVIGIRAPAAYKASDFQTRLSQSGGLLQGQAAVA